MACLARETAATATASATAMFDCWRWCSCWYWCSRAAGQAAAPQAAPEDALEAIKSVSDALEAWGGRKGRGGREDWGGDTLREARRLLESPCAESAASALIAISAVVESCDEEAFGAVKAAERAVRDVVVLRCRSQADPGDSGAFLYAAVEAFGRPLERELEACLILAFHKLRRA